MKGIIRVSIFLGAAVVVLAITLEWGLFHNRQELLFYLMFYGGLVCVLVATIAGLVKKDWLAGVGVIFLLVGLGVFSAYGWPGG